MIAGMVLFLNKPRLISPSIDFGYELKEEDFTIQKIIPEEIEDVEIFAYDFKLSSGQPESSIEISIPYNDKGLTEEEERLSVCGKYYNEETKEWEDVFYTLDTKNNVVNIITNHLSTYGVFKVTNPEKRNAYISEVNVFASYMSKEKALNLIETYSNKESGWQEDVISSTLEAFGGLEMFEVTSVAGLITLGGAYDSYVSKAFNNSISNLGMATACTQLIYDAYSNGFDSKNTAISAAKTALGIAINMASPSIQLAYIGVGFIDYALTDVSTFAVSNKYNSTKNMYDAYYKRNGVKREIKDWVKLFEKMYKDNKTNPDLAIESMQKEIDRYVKEYWEVSAYDYESWIDSYDKNGNLSKYPWPEKEHRENISNIHKQNLLLYLRSAIKIISRNIYLDALEAMREEYNKVASYYNKKYTVNIIENVKKGKSATWDGYYARFSPLPDSVESRSWTVKLDESGSGKITFTLLGHINANFPMKINLYKDGTAIETGEISKTLTLKEFSSNSQTIYLTSRNIEEVEEPKEEQEEKPIEKPSTGPIQEENPWYEITIQSSDGTNAFAGWSAVLGYSSDSSPDLKNSYKEFNSNGKCVMYVQENDIDSYGSITQFWLYQNSADLLAKKKADVIVNFSLSGSYSGELHGEKLYKSVVRAKPKADNKPDILESISGKYESYMTYSLYVEEYDLNGTINEMRNEQRFANYEKPSADVTLHYNGNSLSYMSSANPYQSFGNEILLDKLSDHRYKKEINTDGIIYTYYVEIISAGNSAKITISSERDNPKKILKQEYHLDFKYED